MKMANEALKLILNAVEAQANDGSLWFQAPSIGEAYIQQSLRDLHRVIETGDITAYQRIWEQGQEHRMRLKHDSVEQLNQHSSQETKDE